MKNTRTISWTPLSLLMMSLLGVGGCSSPIVVETPTQVASTTADASSAVSSQTPELSSSVLLPPAPPETNLRAHVAQLMMVGVRDFDDALWALEQGAGGIFIGSTTDAGLLTQPGRDIAELRRRIPRPFAVGIDFEGGRVLRHADVLGNYPAPQVMAETKTPQQVRELAKEMADSLSSHGITVNFAPVVDLDAAGLEVVGDRAFSADPATAATYATAFAQGMIDGNVTPVFKHFPGHGRASGDSHYNSVVTPPLSDLQQHDLVPYATVLADVPQAAVMLGHLVVPDLTHDQPATLSPDAYRLLRDGGYGAGAPPFNGTIITDDLSGMKAISDSFTIEEAASSAIAAGADQALWITTDSLPQAIDSTLKKVEDGTLNSEQITEKAKRVSHYQR